MTSRLKPLPWALLLFYFVTRIALDFWWRRYSPYYAYVFEVLFVFVAIYFYHHRLRFSFLSADLPRSLAPGILSGFAVFSVILSSGIVIPFNFSSLKLLFLLIVVAPLLEELIFRVSLWEPLKDITSNYVLVLILSAVFFSLSHLLSYFFVPEKYKSFVLIQTLYVFALGLGAGWRRLQTSSILSPILVHFGFNFGFYLGSVVFLAS